MIVSSSCVSHLLKLVTISVALALLVLFTIFFSQENYSEERTSNQVRTLLMYSAISRRLENKKSCKNNNYETTWVICPVLSTPYSWYSQVIVFRQLKLKHLNQVSKPLIQRRALGLSWKVTRRQKMVTCHKDFYFSVTWDILTPKIKPQ